jgi:hypothetical protein
MRPGLHARRPEEKVSAGKKKNACGPTPQADMNQRKFPVQVESATSRLSNPYRNLARNQI